MSPLLQYCDQPSLHIGQISAHLKLLPYTIIQDATKQTFGFPRGPCTYVSEASQKPIWMNELCLAQDIIGMITPWVKLPQGLLCLLCYILMQLEPDAHRAQRDTIPGLRHEDWELLTHDTVIHLRFTG